MNEHLSREEMEQFRARTLSPKDLLRVDDHLSRCKHCSSQLLSSSIDALSNFSKELEKEEPSHLSYQQLEALVDGRLITSEQENVRQHLESCSRCRAEEADLSEFKRSLESAPIAVRQIADRTKRVFLIAAVFLIALMIGVLFFRIHFQRPGADAMLPPEYASLVEKTMSSGKLETPDLRELTPGNEVLMGESQPGMPFLLLSPVGIVIETDRPTFSWQKLNGAGKYIVTVVDRAGNEVDSSGWITETRWIPGKPIPRGAIYAWQVTAYKDGQEIASPRPPSGEARFKVLSENEYRELKSVRSTYPDSHLLLGILYAKAGLIQQAEQELRSANAPSLLKQIQNPRH